MGATLLAAVLLGGMLLDGTARLEGRAGSRVAGQPTPDSGLAALALSLQDDEGAFLWRAGIAPQLLVANPGGGVVERVFARAHAAMELRDHAMLRFQLRQDLAYGSIDLSPLAGLPVVGPGPVPPGAQPPPATPIVLLEESTTYAAVQIGLSRRTRLSTDGAWQVSGGADQASRNSVPLARGGRLRAQLSHSLTRVDQFDAELSGFDTRYSNGRRVSVANALIGWATILTRGGTLQLGAGPSVGRGVDSNGRALNSLLYIARADLVLLPVALGARGLSLSIRAAAEPVGDVLSGDLTERGGITVGVAVAVARDLTLNVRATGSLALTSGVSGASGTIRGDRYGVGELSAIWAVSRQIDASVGARGSWLSRPVGGLPHAQWVAFVAFTFYPFRR
jgi:hypothetical protein